MKTRGGFAKTEKFEKQKGFQLLKTKTKKRGSRWGIRGVSRQ